MSQAQITRRIAHVLKLKTHAAKKRRPARVRHYDRMLTELHFDLVSAQASVRVQNESACA